MPPPTAPKIYHILHLDKLPTVLSEGCLWCDAEIAKRNIGGSVIGMQDIKDRRKALTLSCRPGLHVADCVPFYFCPRSIMLYLIYMQNHPKLTYRGGQGPIMHFEMDLQKVVDWADQNGKRWAFTLSNAGAVYFEDRCDMAELDELNWNAIQATQWSSPSIKEGKQAEFLLEESMPWNLVERIGVLSQPIAQQATNYMLHCDHRPPIGILRDWYY